MTTYIDPKNVNTNLLSNGLFVEQVNPNMINGAVNFNVRMAQFPAETHTSYDADSTAPRPGGGTVPVVTIDNSTFRNPLGDGSKYDHISVPNS